MADFSRYGETGISCLIILNLNNAKVKASKATADRILVHRYWLCVPAEFSIP